MRTPWTAQNVENWMSSVSEWNCQPRMPSTILAEIRYPDPETAQEVPQIMRALLRKRASHKNAVAYAAEIQELPKFLELR